MCRFFFVTVPLVLSGCASFSPLAPLEQRLLYHPGAPATVPAHSDIESVYIEGDAGRLHGIFLEHPEPQGVLLYCHGNAGTIVDRLPRLRQLRSRYSLTVFGFDYRGYGQSPGRPSEAGLYADARAARRWLAQRAGISEEDVIVLGRSLGGAVAVELASQDGARGLILENTFSSAVDVGKSMLPWIPASAVRQRFDSAGRIADYHGPLIQTHGTEDRVIPWELGRRLFEEAGEPRVFVTADGGHNDPPSAEYSEQLAVFIDGL